MDTQSVQQSLAALDLLGTERLPAHRYGQGFDTATWVLLAGAVLFSLMVGLGYLLQQEGESLVVTTWRD